MEDKKILIVEDEILIAEDLKDTLLNLGFQHIELAHDKRSALEQLQSFRPDVTLLDIRLESDKEGLEIGSFITKNKLGQFIYVTAHSDVEMVKEIIKTNPTGYITKPVKKSDLFASIGIALEKANQGKTESHPIQIKDGYETILIDASEIRYIEAEGNYLNIFCEQKKYVVRQSLDAFLEETQSPLLYKIHRSFVVNVKKVKRFSKKEIQLDNDVLLPVSRSIKDDFESFMRTASL